MKLFTVGTDHRKSFDFSRLLLKYGIEVIFDIRRMPEAQEEHFRRDGLQALAAAQGIDYIYLGNELGAPRAMSTSEWHSSDEFRRGISIVSGKVAKRACCLLCAERLPEHCHRLQVADELKKSGVEVIHILDETSTWQPPPVLPRPERTGPPDRRRFRPSRPNRGPQGRGRGPGRPR